MSSQGAPSSAELENLGVFFIGFIIATFLYGVTFFQSYIYFSRYTNDSRRTKVLTLSLAILDTASAALVSYLAYYYLIKMFNVEMEVLYVTPVFCVQGLLASTLTLIAQLFFASRLYTVCGGPASIASKIVALVVCCLAFVAFGFGLVSVGQTFQQRELSAFASHPMTVVAGVSQGLAAAAYVLIFIAMCWALRPIRYPDMPTPDSVFEKVAALFASRPSGLTVIQLACFGAFVALPTQSYWIALQIITCRFCVNTVIGILIFRKVKHGVGVHVEESVSDTHDSANDGLPTLRFRLPTATKTTQQTRTLNFTTGIEVESGGTGTDTEEASKSCRDDENLSSIRSQCSEQPEDKTRLSSEQVV